MSQARLFRHKIQEVGVNVHRLHEGNSGIVNVLIHGFTAITENEHLEEFRKLASQFPECTTLLIHWDSGDAKSAAKSKALSSVVSAGALGLGMFTGGLGGIAARIGVSAASTVASAGLGVAASFGENQEKADRLAYALNEILDLALTGKEIISLNLIGHSLGGRIIVNGLLWAHEYIKYSINKVVLMGAAVEWPKSSLPTLNSSDITVYNFYSTSDGALTVKTDFERCIGKHGIPEEHTNVLNFQCMGYGHTEYWPTLKSLLDYTGVLPSGNTLDLLDILNEVPMKMLHLLLSDEYLYPILKDADEQELASLAEILGERKLTDITKDERNPIKIGVEIQNLGGESVANKSRGHGVSYATIIKDVASFLGIPLHFEQVIEKDKAQNMSTQNSLKSKLRGRLGVTAKKETSLHELGILELEEAIVTKVIEQCQSQLENVSDEDFDKQLFEALKSSGRNVSLKASTLRSSLGAGGVAGVAATCVAVPVIGWAVGAAAVGAATLAAATTTLSSAAYQALIPCIVFINTIRMKQEDEDG